MSDDIVTRLRKEIRKRDREYPVELLPELSEAADQIERLRTQLEMWQDGNIMAESHHDEIKRLTAERDEARRMYCKAVADHYEYACNAELDGAGPYTQKDVAKDEGWDCFKEDGK